MILIFTANAREKLLAEMQRTNCIAYINGMKPLLLRYREHMRSFYAAEFITLYSEGYLAESVDTMQQNAIAELQDLSVRLYSRWNFAWAVKKP